MNNEIIDIDKKDIIGNSPENTQSTIDVIKKYIKTNKDRLEVFMTQSKMYYNGMISDNKTYYKNKKFSTSLYALIVCGKEMGKGINHDSLMVIPSTIPNLMRNFLSQGIMLSENIYNKIANLVNNTPANCICHVGIDIYFIIIWYCPIIDPTKDRTNILTQTYVLYNKQRKFIYKSQILLDHKVDHNKHIKQLCLLCDKPAINIVHCPNCDITYCSTNCQQIHADRHKSFCKNLQETQSDTHISNRICAYCKKYNKSAKLCIGCNKVRYCNTDCQKHDWKTHKKTCKYKN